MKGPGRTPQDRSRVCRILFVDAELIRFGLVGASGFVVDTVILYTVLAFGDLFYVGRIVSFMGAVTFTWYMNRVFTFVDREGSMFAQWRRFVFVNSGGGLINYGVYAALISSLPLVTAYPILGVAAGSLSGMVFNFMMSRKFVFFGRLHSLPFGNSRV